MTRSPCWEGVAEGWRQFSRPFAPLKCFIVRAHVFLSITPQMNHSSDMKYIGSSALSVDAQAQCQVEIKYAELKFLPTDA
mmetsp:Transcript_19494/g.48700  ORF Transcript_19494/g.48700 Transcript_19494/m.48700 type:complete len:80 (+) Transcript_19494:1383-1622(+)